MNPQWNAVLATLRRVFTRALAPSLKMAMIDLLSEINNCHSSADLTFKRQEIFTFCPSSSSFDPHCLLQVHHFWARRQHGQYPERYHKPTNLPQLKHVFQLYVNPSHLKMSIKLVLRRKAAIALGTSETAST